MKRPLFVFVVAAILGTTVFVFCNRTGREARDDLVLTFSGWTNIDPAGGPFGNVKGFVPAAFGPSALLTVSNRNTSKQIEFFSAVSIESFKDGEWIEVARAAELPWLIAGNGPDAGAARQQPVRIVEELPRENPWRVKVKYNLIDYESPAKAVERAAKARSKKVRAAGRNAL
jgi:hypothetical protein